MLTVAQWTNARRVDHVNLGIANPRFRGASVGNRDLKVFDADVAAYPLATNNFDRVTVLGHIITQTRQYLNLPMGTVEQRYTNAVNTLYNAAVSDMNAICGGLHQGARQANLLTIAAHGALTPKTVNINVFYLAPVGAAPAVGPIDVIIDAHVLAANQAAGYVAAGITVVRANAVAVVATQTAANHSLLMAGVGVPLNKVGKFADGGVGGPRLITYCNASGGAAGSIDVVYLDNFDQADVQGRTFRAGADYGGSVAARPIVTVTLNPPAGGAATYPTTFAHELGHALTGEPDHSMDGANFMSGGAIRNGTDNLSPGHIAWFRNNAYAA